MVLRETFPPVDAVAAVDLDLDDGDEDDDRGVDPGLVAAEERMARRDVWRAVLANAGLVGLWYLFSISITVYNKWMFHQKDGQTASTNVFPFPLFTTCIHMVVQFCLATLVLYLVPRYRPTADLYDAHHHSSSASEPRRRWWLWDPKKPVMTRLFYLTRIGPCGAATGLDIGLGNMSFRFITLTFYTMCKSSVLGFVLLFAIAFGLEKPSWKLGAIIATMSVGVFLMVAGETQFHTLGFLLIMSSAASSGFRWSLTQILLVRHAATANPFASIFFLAPVMFATLLLLAIPVEGLGALLRALAGLSATRGGPLAAAAVLLFPGCLAFAMTASEFALLQRTSVVTLSICGILKEVLTISAASIVFHDEISTVNGIGLLVTIATIAAYNYFKIARMRDDAAARARAAFELAPPQSARPGGVSVAVGADAAAYLPVPEEYDDDLEADRLLRVVLPAANGSASAGEAAKLSPVKRPEDRV